MAYISLLGQRQLCYGHVLLVSGLRCEGTPALCILFHFLRHSSPSSLFELLFLVVPLRFCSLPCLFMCQFLLFYIFPFSSSSFSPYSTFFSFDIFSLCRAVCLLVSHKISSLFPILSLLRFGFLYPSLCRCFSSSSFAKMHFPQVLLVLPTLLFSYLVYFTFSLRLSVPLFSLLLLLHFPSLPVLDLSISLTLFSHNKTLNQ